MRRVKKKKTIIVIRRRIVQSIRRMPRQCRTFGSVRVVLVRLAQDSNTLKDAFGIHIYTKIKLIYHIKNPRRLS